MKKLTLMILFSATQYLLLFSHQSMADVPFAKKATLYQFLLTKKDKPPQTFYKKSTKKITKKPHRKKYKSSTHRQLAVNAAKKYRIPVKIFLALVQQESSWRVHIISKRGAVGLAQLMPKTARVYCNLRYWELKNPKKNLNCGAKYLAAQVKRFNSLRKAVCSFNAGPTAVAKWGGCPPFKETQRYVRRVMVGY